MGQLINGEKIDFRKDFSPEIGSIKECKRNFNWWTEVKIGSKYLIINSYNCYGVQKCTVEDIETKERHQISVQCFDRLN